MNPRTAQSHEIKQAEDTIEQIRTMMFSAQPTLLPTTPTTTAAQPTLLLLPTTPTTTAAQPTLLPTTPKTPATQTTSPARLVYITQMLEELLELVSPQRE
jgi:hypothetical protein